MATRRKHIAIEGRKRIAAELSRICGAKIQLYFLDRLMVRRGDPLPVHGVDLKVWAFSDELAAWWKRNDRLRKVAKGRERSRKVANR